jgi:hypothetical protein
MEIARASGFLSHSGNKPCSNFTSIFKHAVILIMLFLVINCSIDFFFTFDNPSIFPLFYYFQYLHE